MKCILLCAGYATRLFPLTENFPKALLEVGGRPLLDYILDEVNTIEEIDSIYLVTNAKYTPHFEKWADDKNNIKPITVINDGTYTNDDRLGAIGDINYTIETCKLDDDLLIIAGDNLFTFKLNDFVSFQKKLNTPAVCVRREEDLNLLKRVGVVELDENNKILSFEEKPAEPKSNFAVYAEYLYPKNVIPLIKQYLDEGYSNDAPGNFVTYLHKKIDTYAFAFDGVCYDVGTHEALKEVNEIYSK
jgi:glucose-1-phosphate thymidylyltransferase